MKGRATSYSDEELAWIEAHATLPRRELHAAFIARFGREDVSLSNLTALCKRRRWLTGRTGQFTPGQESWNKGRKVTPHPNAVRTQFKKGERRGKAKTNYKPIGTERVTEDGYLERKVHDGLPLQSRWRAVHLIEWEAVHGPVPEGHCLKCLDGNRQNTDPANWRAVPRAMLPRLAGRWSPAYDSAPDELKPAIMATAELAEKARQARKTRQKGSRE